jgi:hypothetical protein
MDAYRRFKNSLLPEKNSLIRPCKFPVLLRREFVWKTLNSLVDWTPKSELTASFGKIPCILPVGFSAMTPEFLFYRGFIHFALFLICFYFGFIRK